MASPDTTEGFSEAKSGAGREIAKNGAYPAHAACFIENERKDVIMGDPIAGYNVPDEKPAFWQYKEFWIFVITQIVSVATFLVGYYNPGQTELFLFLIGFFETTGISLIGFFVTKRLGESVIEMRSMESRICSQIWAMRKECDIAPKSPDDAAGPLDTG